MEEFEKRFSELAEEMGNLLTKAVKEGREAALAGVPGVVDADVRRIDAARRATLRVWTEAGREFDREAV